MSYSSFKKTVLKNAGYQCEVPGCDATANTVHHFIKRSLWSRGKEDPDNGMACCGPCHAEIERRERQKENVEEMLPAIRFSNARCKWIEDSR